MMKVGSISMLRIISLANSSYWAFFYLVRRGVLSSNWSILLFFTYFVLLFNYADGWMDRMGSLLQQNTVCTYKPEEDRF